MSGVRVDQFLLACLGEFVHTVIEPRCNNVPLWDAGVQQIAAEKLREIGVTDKPLTFVDLARLLGVLGKDPNVIDTTVRRVPRNV